MPETDSTTRQAGAQQRLSIDEWLPLPTEHRVQGAPGTGALIRTFVAVVPLPERPLRWDAHLVLFRRDADGEDGAYVVGRLDHEEDEQRSYLVHLDVGCQDLPEALRRLGERLHLALTGQDGQ